MAMPAIKDLLAAWCSNLTPPSIMRAPNQKHK